MLLVEEGAKEGVLKQGEVELIKSVLDLDNTEVCEICTPMTQVRSLPDTSTIREALGELKNIPFSRIPIMNKKQGEVVGILYAKDLLLTRLMKTDEMNEVLDQTVAVLMRKPMLIAESTPLNTVFRKMKKSQMHLAIVTRDSGKPAGVVTMNGVLHALFEDLLTDETEAEKLS
jgi:CBS domain containing-hemolysin-like protein